MKRAELADAKHIISMTIDWTDGDPGVSVGTCACGWSHREPRYGTVDGGRDPAIVAERRAAAERMDAAIAAHWHAQGGDMLKMGR
jgi:hypothetical protein